MGIWYFIRWRMNLASSYILFHVRYIISRIKLIKKSFCSKFHVFILTEMRIPDPVILCLPDPMNFSLDPDPTCNNGFIKLFSYWTKYKPELPNSSWKWWFIRSTFEPTYLKYKYIFSSFWFKVGSGFFFPGEPHPDSWK